MLQGKIQRNFTYFLQRKVDLPSLHSEELMYQIILQEFENFGVIKLSKPISIKEYVSVAINLEMTSGSLPDDTPDAETIAEVQ